MCGDQCLSAPAVQVDRGDGDKVHASHSAFEGVKNAKRGFSGCRPMEIGFEVPTLAARAAADGLSMKATQTASGVNLQGDAIQNRCRRTNVFQHQTAMGAWYDAILWGGGKKGEKGGEPGRRAPDVRRARRDP